MDGERLEPLDLFGVNEMLEPSEPSAPIPVRNLRRMGKGQGV